MTASSKLRSSAFGRGLAGAAAMAAGSSGYAAIVTPALPPDLPANVGTTTGPVSWDVDGGGTDFVFNFRFPNSTGATGVVWQANMNPVTAAGNAVAGYSGPFINYATNFIANSVIGSNIPNSGANFALSWRSAAQVTMGSVYRSGGVPSAYGGFGNGAPPGPGHTNPGGGQPMSDTGFVGFRLGSGANAKYGWLQLRTNSTVGIDFIAAGYSDTPGMGVFAGDGEIPEPASLSLLALGAAALLRRRA